MAKNDLYATFVIPGTKKIFVGSKRVGARERMTVIATCTNEDQADKIVDGLNLLQGKLTELEVPAQRVLTEVRSALTTERSRTADQAIKIRGLEGEVNTLKRELDNVRRERAIEQAKLVRERQSASEIADVLVATGNG